MVLLIPTPTELFSLLLLALLPDMIILVVGVCTQHIQCVAVLITETLSAHSRHARGYEFLTLTR